MSNNILHVISHPGSSLRVEGSADLVTQTSQHQPSPMVDQEPREVSGVLALLQTICVAHTALADVVGDLLVHQRPKHNILCQTNATVHVSLRSVNRGDYVF